MTRPISLLLASAVLLASCGSKSKDKTADTDSSAVNTTMVTAPGVTTMQNMASEMQKNVQALQKLTPLTLDQLKAVVPEQINGINRSNYSATSMAGASYVEAQYKINDTTNVHVSVWDCAGTAGAGIYNAQFMMLYNFQQEDEYGYTKTQDFNGGKAVIKYEKANNSYTATYFTGDRYLVAIRGTNTSLDALADVAKTLNLK